jgi:hypothetical protein
LVFVAVLDSDAQVVEVLPDVLQPL